jgi:hypothetical protein
VDQFQRVSRKRLPRRYTSITGHLPQARPGAQVPVEGTTRVILTRPHLQVREPIFHTPSSSALLLASLIWHQRRPLKPTTTFFTFRLAACPSSFAYHSPNHTDYMSSPKKRKTGSGSTPLHPPPTTRFSTADTGGRRTGHHRQRSDLSRGGSRGGSVVPDQDHHSRRPSAGESSAPQEDHGHRGSSLIWQQHQVPSPHNVRSGDPMKVEEQGTMDSGGAAGGGGFGSQRSSQPPHSSGRVSEDVEMAER